VKQQVLLVVEEAIRDGARKKACCELIGISIRTLQNWKREGLADHRKGAEKWVPAKISRETRRLIIQVCTSDRFKDMTPAAIVATLAQERTYYASESTFYRILRAENLVHHRNNSKPGKTREKPPELVATGPGQVFCWDITWLPLRVKGLFVYAYVVLDIFDRTIVGWEIHANESEELARDLFARLARGMNMPGAHLHADNGNPMKGLTLLSLLHFLQVSYSFSRPRVSDDNPYIESVFKTVKYTAGYPGSFRDIDHARQWFADFVNWYNNSHLHSSLGYVTPMQKRKGDDFVLFSIRNQTMEMAKRLHPERWGKRNVRKWIPGKPVVLNPGKKAREEQDPVAYSNKKNCQRTRKLS
jgi:putative transposase